MQKKVNILLVFTILLSFITISSNATFAGKRNRAQDEEVGKKVNIDDVDLSNEEAEMLADKGQIRDLKSRITIFNKYRKEIEENAKNCGDDLVDSTSMVSDIDRHISDLEAAELGELTQGEYFDLVRDSSDLAKSIENYYAEIDAAVERGQATVKDVKDYEYTENSMSIKNTDKDSEDGEYEEENSENEEDESED